MIALNTGTTENALMIEAALQAGMFAARHWEIDPSTTKIQYFPKFEMVKVSKLIESQYDRARYIEDVVTLECFRGARGSEIWIGYSKLCNILAVHVPVEGQLTY